MNWWLLALLKFNDRWFCLLNLLEKITSWASLLGSRFCLSSLDYHWNSFLIKWSWTTEKRKLSSTNSLGFEGELSEVSLMKIKKRKSPRTDLWGTPALTSAHEEYWQLRMTLCLLISKKAIVTFNRLPVTPFCFNLLRSQLCQGLSNAFDISRKTPLTSYPWSKDL